MKKAITHFEMSQKGGKATAKKLGKKGLFEKMRKAAQARWNRGVDNSDSNHLTIDTAKHIIKK